MPDLHASGTEIANYIDSAVEAAVADPDMGPIAAAISAAIAAADVEVTRGPFTLTHSTVGIDTGVALWTPAVGERIVGLWIELTEVFDTSMEALGIGYAATIDADLAFQFPLSALEVPAAHASFDRGQGVGFSQLTEVVRIKHTTPLVARTVIGGNTTGALQLWVRTIPA